MEINNERLAMVDASIEYYKGRWPTGRGIQESDRYGLFFVGFSTEIMHMSHGPNSDKVENVCSKEQFEQRAKELQNKPTWVDAPYWAEWLLSILHKK